RLLLEYLQDQCLLAQVADVLDVHLAGNAVEVGDALFFQLGEVHPSGGRLSGTLGGWVAALASVSAGAHETAPGAAFAAASVSGSHSDSRVSSRALRGWTANSTVMLSPGPKDVNVFYIRTSILARAFLSFIQASILVSY